MYMKLLITETQYNILLENIGILSLKDLSKMVCRLGYFEEDSQEIWHKIFISAFKSHGDPGVIELFKDATHLNIEDISKGKYIFKYH